MLKDDLNKKCSEVYPPVDFHKDFYEYRKNKMEVFTKTLLKMVAEAIVDTKRAEKASRLISLSNCRDVSKVFDAYLTVRHSEKKE